MKLHEITDFDQFPAYYESKQLASATEEEKIKHLRDEMKITAIRHECGGARSNREVLQGLEEYVIVGGW